MPEKEKGNLISRRMETLELKTHPLGMLSGVSDDQIKKIRNKESKPGREILIRLGLVISRNLNEINELLREYKKTDISIDDIEHFYKAIDKRKIIDFHPCRPSSLDTKVSLISIEQKKGDIKLVNSSPPSQIISKYIYKNIGLKTQEDKDRFSNTDDTEQKLLEALDKRRIEEFDKFLDRDKFYHLMCEEGLKKIVDGLEENGKSKFFEMFFHYIRKDNYKIKLIKGLHRLEFQLKFSKNKPVNVVFLGTPLHQLKEMVASDINHNDPKKSDGFFSGFLSNQKRLCYLFDKEYNWVEKNFQVPGLDTDDKIIRHLEKKFF